MADYCCAIRTNYFHVKDPEKFKSFMKTVVTSESALNVWEERDDKGNPIFGFGTYSLILGVPYPDYNNNNDTECDEYDYDEFITQLSENVADDDAIIIFESGNENLRYLVGSAIIITNKESEFIDIGATATDLAAKMLGRKDWTTKIEY